jgi:predicted neuraminidase
VFPDRAADRGPRLWLFPKAVILNTVPDKLPHSDSTCFREEIHPMIHIRKVSVLVLVLGMGSAVGAELPEVAKPGAQGYIKGELIYPLDDKPTPQCHASTIVETPAGMVAAWFGGQHEKNPDVGIWVARLVNEDWTKPVEVANGVQSPEKRHPCWNPVLFQPKTGPLMLFYKVGPSPSEWWGMLMTSDDNGQTWSKPKKMGTDARLGDGNPNLLGPVKNKPIQLPDGSIVCPSSSEHKGWRVHFEITKDGGKTWEVIGPIHDASKFNAIQPSILTYADGKMQILCRTQESVLGQSWSADGGKTWSEVTATELPNPNSGTDAVTLADGRQLLVYNHTTRQGGFPSGRNMLNVAVSKDGKSWNPILTLEKEPKSEFSYPAVIQAADGKIHITYTYQRQSVKHVVLDPMAIP